MVRLALAAPRRVLTLWILLAAAAGWGLVHLRIETSTDSVLDRGSARWEFYKSSQNRFGGDEILTIAVPAPAPYAPEVLKKVVELTRAAEAIPGVWRVDSLATVPLVRAGTDGEVSLEPALTSIPTNDSDLAELITAVEADRIAPRTLVADDGRTFAVNLVLDKDAETNYEAILTAVERLGGENAWISGVPVFRTEADRRTRAEIFMFVPVTVLLIGLLVLFVFSSARAVWLVLAPSGLGTWIVLGTMGATGTALTISTVLLPSVLLAIGCAYGMHLLAAATGTEKDLPEALESVALPIALSGLTTSLGFVALSLVRIETIRDLGAFGGLGVLVVLAASLTVGPAVLALRPTVLRRRRFRASMQDWIARRLVRLVVKRRVAIIGVWLLALGCVSSGVSRISIETDVILWFSKSDPVRVAYDEIKERLAGISPMNIVVESPTEDTVDDAATLKAIDGLAAHLESLESVGRSLSIADPLRQINGGFKDDQDFPLPTDIGAIQQYLLILEAKEYIRDLITADRSAASIALRANDNGSKSLMGIAEEATTWWEANGVDGVAVQPTGIMYEFARAEDEIANGQIRGLAFALLAVAIVLLLTFRSWRFAAVGLVPNAVPIAMAFGAMGFLDIPLDAGTVAVGCLALGIAVDDSIHIMTEFYQGVEEGAANEEALSRAIGKVLRPLVLTTLALSIGFGVLGLSGFTLVRHLGLLVTGLMVLCLLADLFLLPALLLGLRGRRVIATE